MEIQTTRFGTQEIEQETLLHFPEGLLGDSNNKDFKLFHKEGVEPDPIIFWLQSVDNPDIAYTIVNPSHLGFYFELALPDSDYQLLESQAPEDIMLMIVISGVEDGQMRVEKEGFTTINGNVTTPLILNLNSRKGIQRSIKTMDYDIFLNIPVMKEE